MNRYLITGGSGFIGTNLVAAHLGAGDIVLSLDASPPRNPDHLHVHESVDLMDMAALEVAVTRFSPTHVYHLGARTDLDGKVLDDYQENTTGVENLISALRSAGSVERVIFASSRLVCRIGYSPKSYHDYCPTTPYGESKVIGEKIVHESDMPWSWCIIRPTSIWGPWFGVPYRNFFDMVRKGVYLHPNGKKVFKSFGFVGNSVFELMSLMQAPDEGVHKQSFYIGDYEPIEVSAFAGEIAVQFQVSPPRSVPMVLLRAAALVGDILSLAGLKAPLTSFRLNNLVTPMPHDFSDLARVVGPLPYSVADGVALTVQWMKRHAE